MPSPFCLFNNIGGAAELVIGVGRGAVAGTELVCGITVLAARAPRPTMWV